MKPPQTVICLVLSALLFSSQTSLAGDTSSAQSDEYKPTMDEMITDGLIYRPLGVAATVVGTGIFIVTLPFSLLGGNADDAGERLVAEPARDTFRRCLGCALYYHRFDRRY
ncbi:MAG: hypothetical protein ACE5GZ_00180 [Gammaproteobacteria bacterium]